MNELNTYNSERIYWAVEQVEQEAGDIDDLHLDDNLFYIKSEVDKVLAGLKNVNERLKKQSSCTFGDDCLRVRQAERELRHQKYKRCLAMAKLCHWKMCVFIYKKEKSNYYYKWHKRWIEIAEKFKEANNGTY